VKLFSTFEVEEAVAHAADGGQSLHLHQIIVDRAKAPGCFVSAVNRGEPIAHLFYLDRDRLIATAKRLGVKVIFVDRDRTASQHIDLCAGPLRKAYTLLEAGQEEKLKGLLAAFKARA
jgi:hypothetical protein